MWYSDKVQGSTDRSTRWKSDLIDPNDASLKKDILEDEDLTDEEKTNGKCIDVAKQFDLEKDPIDIAFGGGWRYFCREEDRTDDRKCRRLDGGSFQNLFSKIIFWHI